MSRGHTGYLFQMDKEVAKCHIRFMPRHSFSPIELELAALVVRSLLSPHSFST